MKEETVNWYAAKVFYNKVFDIESLLQGMGLETFLPVRLVPLKGADHMRAARRLATPDARRNDSRYLREGPVIFERKPLVNSLIFFQCGQRKVKLVQKEMEGKGFVYSTTDRRKASPIPPVQMTMFRLAVSAADGLTFFSSDDFTRYKAGDRVRVKAGPLAGLEGYIKRIKKDRRLLVSIEGVIAVATSYMPPEMLEIVPEPSTGAS